MNRDTDMAKIAIDETARAIAELQVSAAEKRAFADEVFAEGLERSRKARWKHGLRSAATLAQQRERMALRRSIRSLIADVLSQRPIDRVAMPSESNVAKRRSQSGDL